MLSQKAPFVANGIPVRQDHFMTYIDDFLREIENIVQLLTLLSEDIEFVINSDMQQVHFKFSFGKRVVFL